MSWKPEVQILGEGEKWHRNGLVFETKAEAEAYAADNSNRWLLVGAHRAVEVDEPVNYCLVDGRPVPAA